MLIEYGGRAASAASAVGCLLTNLNPEAPPTNLGAAGIIGGAGIAHAGTLAALYGFSHGIPIALTLFVSVPLLAIGAAFIVLGVIALFDICGEA